MAYAERCAQDAWRKKRLYFNEQVEKSWQLEGGALPFRLVKEPQKPPVTDMTIQLPVKLLSQRWSPAGKFWIKVSNPSDFPVGCLLQGDRFQVQVLHTEADYVQVDRLLTRREASQLYRSFVSAEPEVWTEHFLSQWNSFWNRPVVEQEAIDQVLQSMPHYPPLEFPPLSLEDWRRALKSARKRTMRGADGWSVQELSWLSDEFTLLLLLSGGGTLEDLARTTCYMGFGSSAQRR